MDIFTRRKKLQGISVHSVFTWKEKSQGISVDSTNDGNNCTTKKVSWNQTERQTKYVLKLPSNIFGFHHHHPPTPHFFLALEESRYVRWA